MLSRLGNLERTRPCGGCGLCSGSRSYFGDAGFGGLDRLSGGFRLWGTGKDPRRPIRGTESSNSRRVLSTGVRRSKARCSIRGLGKAGIFSGIRASLIYGSAALIDRVLTLINPAGVRWIERLLLSLPLFLVVLELLLQAVIDPGVTGL
jgi:hypothetical protein